MVHVLGHPLLFGGGAGSDAFMQTAAQEKRRETGTAIRNESQQKPPYSKQLKDSAGTGMQAGHAAKQLLCWGAVRSAASATHADQEQEKGWGSELDLVLGKVLVRARVKGLGQETGLGLETGWGLERGWGQGKAVRKGGRKEGEECGETQEQAEQAYVSVQEDELLLWCCCTMQHEGVPAEW
jgi:hypothetical protein